MDVGNRIKQLREAKGWTTNRLANRCGISQSFLRSVERNEKGISVASLSIVCDELGLSLKAFFDVPGEAGAPGDDLLRQIEHQRRERLRPVFLQMGLTLGQGQPRILNCLLGEDGVTQTHLARLCGIDAATISRALDKLERAGWICRRQDPDSRRCYRIVLTDTGREKAQQVRQAVREVDQHTWHNFSEEEMEALLAAFERMKKNLAGE